MKIKLNVPKKYEKYFGSLEEERDLIDDCKYMLYFKEGYAYIGEYPSIPCKSKKEALKFLRCGDTERGYQKMRNEENEKEK